MPCTAAAALSLPATAAKLTWPAAPGAAALRAKYAVLAAVLAAGVGVLSTHVATVLLQARGAAIGGEGGGKDRSSHVPSACHGA